MEPGVIRVSVHVERMPSTAPPRPKPSSLDALGTLLLLGMVCVTGLELLQALLRREVEYLSLLGIFLLTLLGGMALAITIITLALVVVTLFGRRGAKRALRLAAESAAGDHGDPVTTRGKAGWLTPEGIILAGGRHFAWASVLEPDLTELGDHVWLRAEMRPARRHLLIPLAVGYSFLLCLALGAVTAATLALGFLGQRGFRFDLAAVVSFSVLALIFCGLGLTFRRNLSRPGSSRLEVAILRARISRDELQRLLDGYLQPR